MSGRAAGQDSATHHPLNHAWFGSLNSALAGMFPNWFGDKLQRDLWRCGYSNPAAVGNYLAMRNFLICAFTSVLALWLILVEDQPLLFQRLLVVGITSAIVLIALPRVIISTRGESRVKRIAAALPDGLDLIAMAMSSGASFQQALEQAAEQLRKPHPELAYELALVGTQSKAGSTAYALGRFQERMDWAELNTVVDNITHAVQLGSGLRSMLETLSDQVRRDRMRRVADRANRNVVLMLFPIVLCLAPAALIMIFTPPVIKLQEFRDQAKGKGGVLSRDALKNADGSVFETQRRRASE